MRQSESRVSSCGAAGHMSIAALIASPVTKGLFRRAIIQSGNGIGIADAQDAGKVAAAVAGKAGIAPSAAAFGKLGPDREPDRHHPLRPDAGALDCANVLNRVLWRIE
jgi:carboxylesterase type B